MIDVDKRLKEKELDNDFYKKKQLDLDQNKI